MLNGDTPLFIALDKRTYGGRLSRRSIQRVIDKYLRAAGLKEQPKKNKGKKPASFQEHQPSNGKKQHSSQSASAKSNRGETSEAVTRCNIKTFAVFSIRDSFKTH